MEYYEAIETGKDYLAHHGVKGMRWGIRHDPERVGRVRKAIARVGNITIRGLRNAGRSTYRAAKRASYRRTQRNIEKAISSGKSNLIDKQFPKMNDSQVQRAVIRMNQRDAVYRSRVEAGKRSLKNVRLQRKVDALNLRNQYRQAKHPELNRNMQKFDEKLTIDLEKALVKGTGKLMTSAYTGAATAGVSKTAAKKTVNVNGGKKLVTKRLNK